MMSTRLLNTVSGLPSPETTSSSTLLGKRLKNWTLMSTSSSQSSRVVNSSVLPNLNLPSKKKLSLTGGNPTNSKATSRLNGFSLRMLSKKLLKVWRTVKMMISPEARIALNWTSKLLVKRCYKSTETPTPLPLFSKISFILIKRNKLSEILTPTSVLKTTRATTTKETTTKTTLYTKTYLWTNKWWLKATCTNIPKNKLTRSPKCASPIYILPTVILNTALPSWWVTPWVAVTIRTITTIITKETSIIRRTTKIRISPTTNINNKLKLLNRLKNKRSEFDADVEW